MTNNIKIVDVIEEGKQEENETVEPIPEEEEKTKQSLNNQLNNKMKSLVLHQNK